MGKKTNGSITVPPEKSNLHFRLGHLNLELSTSSAVLTQFAREFLANWTISAESAESPAFQIDLELVDTLPPLPEQTPIFVAQGEHLPDGVGALSVYQQADGCLLSFQEGGEVRIVINKGKTITGLVTIRLLAYGRLHDLLFTSLAPYLRQRGYYLIHASAAVLNGEAAVFAGPPGCGKSTTVLNLALKGWGVLSNDTLLLHQRPDGIYALPTPGGFSIRPKSMTHLPILATYLHHIQPGEFYHLPLNELGLFYAAPARIGKIFFPQISKRSDNEIRPLSPAIALAQLMELSLDRWDTAAFPNHIAFLEQLSQQAQAFSLNIANQERLPEIIKNVMRKT